jgi:hypothetical protein
VNTFFSVANSDLERLSPQEAVDFFRELLWAEARRLGLPVGKVHVSSWIDVADGGVDASVEPFDGVERGDLIGAGDKAFQIKAGASFEPWQLAVIHNELFGKGKPVDQEHLATRVKECMEKNGTYVLVCFRRDPTQEQRRKAIENLGGLLRGCGYNNPKVELWGQNNLIGFIKRFPSLALRVNGRDHASFQTHRSWSQQRDMRTDLKSGEDQNNVIEGIREQVRRIDEAGHTRVLGESGIGKTRIVLAATESEDIAPLVLYCNASKFRDSDLMYEILREDNQYSVVLVLDECNEDDKAYIWNKLEHCGPRIKVISIYGDYDESSGKTIYFSPPPLAALQTSAIIQDYKLPKDQADRWSELCSGSPRVAHVIGQNLITNPEDLLKSPDTVNVWERYIVGRDDPHSEAVRQRTLVLRHLALYKRFGYEHSVVKDARQIASRIQAADPQITWSRFQEIINLLRTRKLLQGEYTLYIAPKAFHIKLWTDWWDNYGRTFDVEDFTKDLSPKLLAWFYEMFIYARESNAALRIVRHLLGEEGPFQNVDFLNTPLGGRFFLALTKADPESALGCLKRTVGVLSQDELQLFDEGRRSVVWALESIVIWKGLFVEAAKLLLLLAEAENEKISNNASGVFIGLFSNGYGPVASTEASPEERFPVLREALESQAKSRRLIALKACNAALETQNFHRTVGPEHQGLRHEPNFWRPKTYGELFDAYRRIWNVLKEKIEVLPEDERRKAVTVLLKNALGVGRIANLLDLVITTIEELAEKPYVAKQEIQRVVARFLTRKSEDMLPEVRERWEHLKASLEPSDFHAMMARYVALDLLEDKFDQNENYIDQAAPKIAQLAQEAISSPELLNSELEWLVTVEAQRGLEFGFELGKRDKDFALLQHLIDAQRNAQGENVSAFFLGGYFRALRQSSENEWEVILDNLRRDEKLKVLIPELSWRSGLTDRAAKRIVEIARQGDISAWYFRIFGYGLDIQNLSEDIFHSWVEYLIACDQAFAANIAINLFHTYYVRQKDGPQLPVSLTLRVLTQPALYRPDDANQTDQMSDYYWANIANRFVNEHPGQSLPLASIMFEHFGEDRTILGGFDSHSQRVLDQINSHYPTQVWELVKNHLGFPIDARAFHITKWLRGGGFAFGDPIEEGELATIPADSVWQWVDEDIENRAWYLATFVPPSLASSEGRTSLARELLVRYGDRDDVRNNLQANFSTEGWMGNASDHYRSKKESLLSYRKIEKDPNVLRWLDEYVASLEPDIERSKIEEERGYSN